MDDFFWNVLRDKHPSEPLSQNNSLLLSNEINGILTCGQCISKEMILAGGLQETARSGMFFWIIFSCSGFESLRSLNVVNKFFDIWNIWWHWSIKYRSWKISNKFQQGCIDPSKKVQKTRRKLFEFSLKNIFYWPPTDAQPFSIVPSSWHAINRVPFHV